MLARSINAKPTNALIISHVVLGAHVVTATMEKVNTILCLYARTVLHSYLTNNNLGDHSEKSSSSTCDVEDPPPQSAAQLEKKMKTHAQIVILMTKES